MSIATIRESANRGILSDGKKPVKKVIVRSADGEADLTDQTRDAFGGKNLKVRFPEEDTFGGCPAELFDLDPSTTPLYLPIVIK
jgi:hypothetical protein